MIDPEHIKEAFQEGSIAAKTGKGENPYPTGTRLHNEWKLGYQLRIGSKYSVDKNSWVYWRSNMVVFNDLDNFGCIRMKLSVTYLLRIGYICTRNARDTARRGLRVPVTYVTGTYIPALRSVHREGGTIPLRSLPPLKPHKKEGFRYVTSVTRGQRSRWTRSLALQINM